MPPRAIDFSDDAFPSSVMRGLIGDRVWDSGVIGFHLEAGDFDGNGRNDWDENGARQAIIEAFDLWSDVANLTFFETTRSAATLIERISDAGSDPDADLVTLGFHFLPGGNGGDGLRSGEQSDGEYNQEARGWTSSGLMQGGSAFSTIVHEIGHALGLEHPFDDDLFGGLSGAPFEDYGDFGLNQSIYSVMSYNRGWIGNGGRSSSESYGHSGGPMALDIAAIQAVYGANTTYRTGDDVYDLKDQNGSGTFYSTIWDAGGQDTIRYQGLEDATVFLGEATIDDSPTGGGLLSYIDGVRGGFTVARGAVIENAVTGSGDDVVGGNEADNRIETGAGNDLVMGLGGNDVIIGGAGDDILIGDYRSVTEFGLAVTPSPTVYTGPSLPGGTGTGDGLIFVSTGTSNTVRSRATDIGGDFSLRRVDTIEDNEELYSVTVSAESGRDGYAYYRIDFTEAARLTVDIDGAWGSGADAFDSYIELLDADGELILENDDGGFVDDGSAIFAPTGTVIDSFFDISLDAGTYYVKVGQWVARGEPAAPLDDGASYTLNVVVDGYVVETPDLPIEAGLAQFGYYYETPDFSGVTGGYNRGADRGVDAGGHWHAAEDGARVWHATGHDAGCACCGCAADKEATEDAGAETDVGTDGYVPLLIGAESVEDPVAGFWDGG